MASRTAAAPWPASAGPFLALGAAVALHRRQVQQHNDTAGALDQRADRRAVEAEDQIALPVAGHRAIGGLGGPLADHHLIADKALAAAGGAGVGDTQRPAGAQAGGQLAA
jgi:hypothetical protein